MPIIKKINNAKYHSKIILVGMKGIRKIILCTIMVSVLIIPGNAFGIVYDPPIILQQPIPIASDQLGNSVSIDGNNILVGAELDDTGATDTGAAYLFDDAGNLLLTFLNPDPAVNDNFGYSVSIAGKNV